MSQETISYIASKIQSNFHHLINERCRHLKKEFKDFEYPDLTPYFESLISTIKENPNVITIKFGKGEAEESKEKMVNSVRISSLPNWFPIPGFFGGFKIKFKRQVDQKPIKATNINDLCDCSTCLSIRKHTFIELSNDTLDTVMKWYFVTSSWCRIAGGSGRTHKINTEGYVLIDENFA